MPARPWAVTSFGAARVGHRHGLLPTMSTSSLALHPQTISLQVKAKSYQAFYFLAPNFCLLPKQH